MIHALAYHIDSAPLADFGRKPCENFETVYVLGVACVGYRELLERLGLGSEQEGEELRRI